MRVKRRSSHFIAETSLVLSLSLTLYVFLFFFHSLLFLSFELSVFLSIYFSVTLSFSPPSVSSLSFLEWTCRILPSRRRFSLVLRANFRRLSEKINTTGSYKLYFFPYLNWLMRTSLCGKRKSYVIFLNFSNSLKFCCIISPSSPGEGDRRAVLSVFLEPELRVKTMRSAKNLSAL